MTVRASVGDKGEVFEDSSAYKVFMDKLAANEKMNADFANKKAIIDALVAGKDSVGSPDVPMWPTKDLSPISTLLMNVDNTVADPYHASSIPIYQTATYKHSSPRGYDKYAYTRFGNPTRDMLESILAKLDHAETALCYNSGMAALTAVTRLVNACDEIVMGSDIYGGSDLLLQQMYDRTGVKIERVDMSNLKEVQGAISDIIKKQGMKPVPGVKEVKDENGKEVTKGGKFVEGTLLLVDNSIMSPVLSQPLDHGADIVMHSATKFIGGHSDVMAGVLALSYPELAEKLKKLQNAEGTGLAPFDCWVCLRGIKTMALRVERQQENAQQIALFLYKCAQDPNSPITSVNYVGLPKYPGNDIHFNQANGAGSVLSFTTVSVARSENIVKNATKCSLTVSFGNVKSLISMPVNMSHKDVKEEDLIKQGLTRDLIRICVGIENAQDLINNLKEAIEAAIPEKKPDKESADIPYVA